MAQQELDFETTVFEKEYITLAGRREAIVRGGRGRRWVSRTGSCSGTWTSRAPRCPRGWT